MDNTKEIDSEVDSSVIMICLNTMSSGISSTISVVHVHALGRNLCNSYSMVVVVQYLLGRG